MIALEEATRRSVSWACVLLLACGVTSGPAPRSAQSPVSTALLPGTEETDFRSERIRDHVMLVADGQIYATNGDDMPTMLGAAVYPMLAAPERERLRCAVVGIGSGVEASMMASLGCDRVDVLENRREAIDNVGAWDEGTVDSRLLTWTGPFRRMDEPPPGARYDVIVQSVGSTAIDGVHRLFSVERFERLRGLLAQGGVFLQHVQLYEIDAETHRRLMRTLASAFEHLMVFVPEPLTSDSLVLASMAPLRLHLDRLGMHEGYGRWTDRVQAVSWFDPAADLAFATRQEVLADARGAEPITSAAPLQPLPRRPPIPQLRVDGAIDADRLDAYDRAVEEFQARFDPAFVESFHGTDRWAGEPCPELQLDDCPALVPASSEEGDPEEEYALSLIGNGRFSRAIARLNLAPAAAPAGRNLAALLDPDGQSPTDDPLEPFPDELSSESKDAWTQRDAVPSEALAALRAERTEQEPLRSRLALAELMLVVELELDDELREPVQHLEDSSWCLEDSPACLYWLAVAKGRTLRLREAVSYMRSALSSLGPAATDE